MITNVNKPILPALIKIRDAAELLSISRQTVRNLITTGDLVAHEVNSPSKERRHLRITRDSLLKFYKIRFGHSLERALANRFEVSL